MGWHLDAVESACAKLIADVRASDLSESKATALRNECKDLGARLLADPVYGDLYPQLEMLADALERSKLNRAGALDRLELASSRIDIVLVQHRFLQDERKKETAQKSA